MLNKNSTKRVILYIVLIIATSIIAQAEDLKDPWSLPTTDFPEGDYEYHYDPQPPEVDWKIPEGWATSNGEAYWVESESPFRDDNDAPGTDWQWQTEWFNQGPNDLRLTIKFVALDFEDERFPTNRAISVPPGEREVITLQLDESPYEIGGEFDYFMWVNPNPEGPAFQHDCSFCEEKPILIGQLRMNSLTSALKEIPLEENGIDYDVIALVKWKYSPYAWAPKPQDGARFETRSMDLSWRPGYDAVFHDVYFGTVFDDVNNADRIDTRGVLVSQGQMAAGYTLSQRLEFLTTYYWRVDEVSAPPNDTVHKGKVWSFETEPFAYQVQNVTASASSSSVEKGPENTVNGSGLDSNGLHSNLGDGTMWLSDIAGPQPTWIEFEFDAVHKLVDMLIWNYNESFESILGLGFKDVTIEFSTDGVNFMTLGNSHEFTQAPGSADYAHNTTVDMAGILAKDVRLTANSNWGNVWPQFGLSEVRFLSTPVRAREPKPYDGATNMALNLDLSWRPGREAATHNVYFSHDYLAVLNGTTPVMTIDQASYSPTSLDLKKTYFWRVDEINDVETPALWEGQVWEFTTIGYLIIDDFETYTDDDTSGEAIWQHWIDGLDIPDNNSRVGNLETPYAEQTIVHSGKQSISLTYDNTGVVANSEATLTLSDLRDWTMRGAEELSLWFRGSSENAAEPLYVAISDSAGSPAVVAYDDVGAAQISRWTQWIIPLKVFADQGVNLTNVDNIAIGLGTKAGMAGSGGSGTMYFDDIQLRRP